MENFIVANGIVRYKPGITRYQLCDIAKRAEKIIALKKKDIENIKNCYAELLSTHCEFDRQKIIEEINKKIRR